jgi:hypothetical protein
MTFRPMDLFGDRCLLVVYVKAEFLHSGEDKTSLYDTVTANYAITDFSFGAREQCVRNVHLLPVA